MTESKSMDHTNVGRISEINGSLITVKGLENKVRLHDLIQISEENIIAEVIRIYSDRINAQCFEDTSSLQLSAKVVALNEPLSMELGPGLISNVFDGIQRPLDKIFEKEQSGFIKRGISVPALSRERLWHFTPKLSAGDKVVPGDVVGIVQETEAITHYILIPPNIEGELTEVKQEGKYTVDEDLYKIKTKNSESWFNMIQKWPVTKRRPISKRLTLDRPLITGQRVVDLLFPVAKGGTVAVPGGFGTGKTVLQQAIAKWSNADLIVFVSCGERGNEVADLLRQFPELTDPRTGNPLLERTILITNTSNMPVSAREASIFSGITIAEYYRDMGYDVALQADSTSRWAEALREISGLLEEMPAEGGYPAYLPSRLSSFYERAGIVEPLGGHSDKHSHEGSLTVIGSVSPPAGDFSEPVTSNTKRFVQSFWALDAELAYEKHYPAINWLESYSNYPDYIREWWREEVDLDWSEMDINWFECRKRVNQILSRENELENMMQLVGVENLPENQQLDLFIADLIKEAFLIQNAFDDIDNFSTPTKMMALIKIILLLHREGKELLQQGYIFKDIKELEVINEIRRIKTTIPNQDIDRIEEIKHKLFEQIKSLRKMYGVVA